MRALISCVVPVFNGARFLAETIDSILTQTYRPIEVIVVDDGSTDNTPEVIERYSSHIRTTRQGNAGPAAARNTGMDMADGDYFAFLDADDLWLPEKLFQQIGTLNAKPDLDLCFCGIANFSDPTDGDGPLKEWDRPPFSPCTLLARRSLWTAVGPFDPSLRGGEDTEWLCRVFMRSTHHETLPEILVRRRLHDRNLTRHDPPSQEKLLHVLKIALDKRRSGGW